MNNKDMETLILKFLQRYYPVSRIKIINKLQQKPVFRRGILFDDGYIYELSDKVAFNKLYYALVGIIKKVFACNEIDCKEILNKFF